MIAPGTETLLVRNIPRWFTAEHLLAEVDSLLEDAQYNFVVLPWDLRRNANIGYGFLTFRSWEPALACFCVLSGHDWPSAPGLNPCRITTASIQGLPRNLAKFVASRNDGKASMHHCPLVFDPRGRPMDIPSAVAYHCSEQILEEARDKHFEAKRKSATRQKRQGAPFIGMPPQQQQQQQQCQRNEQQEMIDHNSTMPLPGGAEDQQLRPGFDWGTASYDARRSSNMAFQDLDERQNLRPLHPQSLPMANRHRRMWVGAESTHPCGNATVGLDFNGYVESAPSSIAPATSRGPEPDFVPMPFGMQKRHVPHGPRGCKRLGANAGDCLSASWPKDEPSFAAFSDASTHWTQDFRQSRLTFGSDPYEAFDISQVFSPEPSRESADQRHSFGAVTQPLHPPTYPGSFTSVGPSSSSWQGDRPSFVTGRHGPQRV